MRTASTNDGDDSFSEADPVDPAASEEGKRERRTEDIEDVAEERRKLEQRERGLADFADELDEKERTLQEYVTDSIRETGREAIAEVMSGYGTSSRLGNIGSLILGLVGVTLIGGGVLNGFAQEIATVPVVFASDAANLGVTMLLLFSGLAANLAAVAD
ncbi:MAG: hypothetical protein ABEJ73_11730 [Haloplanus sp.]